MLPGGYLRVVLCFAAGMAAAATAFAQREATESGVKAAFLYKFANYIEWPANAFAAPSAPLVIGVMGAEEVAAELDRIAPGRNVNGHPVTVKRLKNGESAAGVHILFVGREQGGAAAAVRAAREQGALTVTESERGLETTGSAINFLSGGERVAFEVSLEAAEKSGHRISSRMLAVAKRVVPRS
jgi:hypothetical protein